MDRLEPEEKARGANEQTWATLCHLSALAGYAGVPLGSVVGPLLVWAIKKDEFPSLDRHGREAMNFQLSILLYSIAAIPLIFLCIGIFLLPALVIFQLVMIIVAAVKASEGEVYRYPLTLRFIKCDND